MPVIDEDKFRREVGKMKKECETLHPMERRGAVVALGKVLKAHKTGRFTKNQDMTFYDLERTKRRGK